MEDAAGLTALALDVAVALFTDVDAAATAADVTEEDSVVVVVLVLQGEQNWRHCIRNPEC